MASPYSPIDNTHYKREKTSTANKCSFLAHVGRAARYFPMARRLTVIIIARPKPLAVQATDAGVGPDATVRFVFAAGAGFAAKLDFRAGVAPTPYAVAYLRLFFAFLAGRAGVGRYAAAAAHRRKVGGEPRRLVVNYGVSRALQKRQGDADGIIASLACFVEVEFVIVFCHFFCPP
jgi:hypothetical protein